MSESQKKADGSMLHPDLANQLATITATLAHELSQPLTVISAYAQACQHEISQCNLELPPLAQKALIKIIEQTQQATNLLYQFRDDYKQGHL